MTGKHLPELSISFKKGATHCRNRPFLFVNLKQICKMLWVDD